MELGNVTVQVAEWTRERAKRVLSRHCEGKQVNKHEVREACLFVLVDTAVDLGKRKAESPGAGEPGPGVVLKKARVVRVA